MQNLAQAGAREALVLSTCNRTELYLAGPDAANLTALGVRELSELVAVIRASSSRRGRGRCSSKKTSPGSPFRSISIGSNCQVDSGADETDGAEGAGGEGTTASGSTGSRGGVRGAGGPGSKEAASGSRGAGDS